MSIHESVIVLMYVATVKTTELYESCGGGKLAYDYSRTLKTHHVPAWNNFDNKQSFRKQALSLRNKKMCRNGAKLGKRK